MALDLLIVGGVVLDPAQSVHARLAIGVKDGLVAYLGEEERAPQAACVKRLRGHLVVPGLVDLHTHVYWAGTSLGICADDVSGPTGVTTYVDAGSAGPGNWSGFHEHVIRKSTTRVLGFINLSVAGLAVVSEWIPRWERTPLQHMSVPAVVEVAQKYPDHVVGVKVLCSGQYNSHGAAPAALAVEAGRLLQKPVMVHFDFPPPTTSEIVSELRRGDILTHCFRGGPNSCLSPDGSVLPAVLEARERGVLFDIGHGVGSLSFEVARGMFAAGFFPDIISSDVHTGCINGPAYDLPTTMSKFLCLGMPLEQVISAATSRPAVAIGLGATLGDLRVGTPADITVLDLQEGEFIYEDGTRVSFATADGVRRDRLVGRYRLRPAMTVRSGEVIFEELGEVAS